MFLKAYGSMTDDMFGQVNSFDASNLRPCLSELQEHIRRTAYIPQIWCNAHLQEVTELPPLDCDWRIDENNKYSFLWFSGDPLPQSIDDVTAVQQNVEATEKQVVKEYVQRIIETQIPSDATVAYAYHKTHNYLTEDITNPKIIMDITKKILNTDVYERYNEMFILEVKHESFFGPSMKLLFNQELTDLESSTRRKYLLIVPDSSMDFVKYILRGFFGLDITHVIILTFDSKLIDDTVTVFTYNPYTAENQCGKFTQVVQRYNYSTIKYIKKPRLLDKYKKCTAVRSIPHNDWYKNMRLNRLYYLEFISVKIILKTLNVSMKLEIRSTNTKRTENFSIGPMNFRVCTKAEKSCSFPFIRDDWVWIVPPPEQLNLLEVFGVIFKKVVWISIALTFILTSIVWWLLSKCIRVSSFTSALMDLYSITLFGSVSRVPSFFQLRVLFIAYIIYIVPIQTIVTSSLIRLLTVPQYGPSIKTVEKIAASDFPIIIAPQQMDLFNHTEENNTLYSKIKNKLVNHGDNFHDALVEMVKHKNAIGIMQHFQANWLQAMTGTKLQFFVDDSLFQPELFSVYAKPQPLLLPSANKIISILIESGLLNYHGNFYELYIKNKTIIRDDSENKVVLSLSHMYAIFVFWAIGISFATSVFFIELLTYYYYYYKLKKCTN
ncbi:hypothetical protein FQA39_LY18414 [Lamprigera yunnana]|nr:hypothetical protein FQA39_LY18414 [Lamprigera yunnana]